MQMSGRIRNFWDERIGWLMFLIGVISSDVHEPYTLTELNQVRKHLITNNYLPSMLTTYERAMASTCLTFCCDLCPVTQNDSSRFWQ
jgi:hypothetical protein